MGETKIWTRGCPGTIPSSSEVDPLELLSPAAWGEWARTAGSDRQATPRNAVNATLLAQDKGMGATHDEDDAPDELDLVRSPAARVVTLALQGKIPRTMQHMLTSITAKAAAVAYDALLMDNARADLISRSVGHSVTDNLVDPLGEPRPSLVWALVQEFSGPGHEWVLDGGVRLGGRGGARRGNLQLHDDAPVPGMAWVTAT